jgi:hypothetical protein
MTNDQSEYVATRLVQIRLVLDDGTQSTVRRQLSAASRSWRNLFGTTRQAQALDVLNTLGPDARAALTFAHRLLRRHHLTAPVRRPSGSSDASARPPAALSPALARQLSDPAVVDAVLSALLKLDKSAAAANPELRRLLESDQPLERTLNIVRVAKRTMPAHEPVEILRRRLISAQSPPIAAARGLELMGPAAAPAIPDLARIARTFPADMGTSSLQILHAIGPDSIPTMIEFAVDGTIYQQAAAACWLGAFGPRAAAAAGPLTTNLASPDPNVPRPVRPRRSAASAPSPPAPTSPASPSPTLSPGSAKPRAEALSSLRPH